MTARLHELLLLRRQYSCGYIAIRPRKIVELEGRQCYLRDSGFVGFADGIVIDIGRDGIKRVMQFSQQPEASIYAGPGQM
jgi:hypothetical protein